MKKNQKSLRKAFNIYALIAGMTILATTGAVVVPSLQNYYIKERVKDVVAKEKLLKDIYIKYYSTDTIIANANDLIDRAKEDGILANTADDDIDGQAGYDFLDNDFGGQISFAVNPVVLNTPKTFTINSNIANSNVYAQGAYRGLTFDVLGTPEGSDANSYTVLNLEDKDILDKIQRGDKVAKKFEETDDKTRNEDLAKTNEGQEWWDYNAKTDTYDVKTWNGTDWDDVKTVSSGVKSADGNYYVNDINEVDATTVASGTKVVINTNGESLEYIAINGRWQIKSAFDSEFAAVPAVVTRFKDMVDRESVKNYFHAANETNTNVLGIWGKNIKFTRFYELNGKDYWESDQADIPHYMDDSFTLNRNIYLADSLDELNNNLDNTNRQDGDVAFLRDNNNAGFGYKGIQELKNDIGKLYPEAVFHNGSWIYYAPRAGDVIQLAFTVGDYFTQDVDKIVSFAGYDTNDGMRRFKDAQNSVFLTQGSRIHFDTVVQANENALYLSAMLGDVVEYPIYSTQGIISKYLSTDTSYLYEWGYSSKNAGEVTNKLADIAEGEEIVVNEENRVGNQGEDKFILQLSGYSGKFVVVYTDVGNIMARVYDGFGEPTTDEIKVSTSGSQNTKPHGAVLKNGNLVLTWQSGSEIRARVFSIGLEPIENSEIVVGNGSVPQIANTYDSTFVVVWQGASSGSCSIPFSSYDYDSTLKHGACVTNNTASHINPKIISASPDANSFMVAWENVNDDRVDANFYTIDSAQHIFTTASLTNIGAKSSVSNITLARKYGGSNFGIAFETEANIYKAKIKSTGVLEDLTVTGSQPSIAFDKDSRVILVYKNNNDIKATFSSSGNDVYDTISQNSHTNQHPIITPIMMAGSNAMFVVAWEVKNGNNIDIAMRFRYYGSGGSAPKYLETKELIVNNINSAGNQYAPLPVSLRVINGGSDEERGASWRYVSVAWTGENIDGDGLGVALRTYNISNIKWKEEH